MKAGKITSKLHPAIGRNAEITKLMTNTIKLRIIKNFCIMIFSLEIFEIVASIHLLRIKFWKIVKDQIDLLKESLLGYID